MTKPITCEVCVESVEGAVAAEAGGANRIELCGELALGGITPSMGLVRKVTRAVSIPVMIMIRPRGGNFTYSASEIDVMMADVQCFLEETIQGIVFGCLTDDGKIDKKHSSALRDAAENLDVTFHRAFDWAVDPFKALETLVDLGIPRVLTSGQQATAEEGMPLLQKLVSKAGNQISVMPGAGINASNVERIISATGVQEVHFSGSVKPTRAGGFNNEQLPMQTVKGYCRKGNCTNRIRDIVIAAQRGI